MMDRELSSSLGAAKTVLIVLLGVLGFVVVAGLGAYMVVAWNVSKRFDREVSKLRAEDRPVGYSGLDRFYDLGPGAASRGQAYVDAFAKFPHDAGEGSLVLYFGETPDIEDEIGRDALEQSRSFLDSCKPSVSELQALAKDTAAVRFPGNAKTWMEVEMPHLAALRAAVRLLCLDATLAAIDGNGDQAIRSIGAAVTVADSIREEPLAISQLVRIACLRLTIDAIEQIVNRSKVSDLQLIRFQGALNQVRPDGLTAHGLIGEVSLAFVDPPGDEEWASLPPTISQPGPLLKFPPYLRLETIYAVQTYDQLLEIGQLTPFDRVEALDAFEQSLDAMPDFGHRTARSNGRMISLVYAAESRCIGLRDAALVALAALRFHSATGGMRDSADELVPAFLKEAPIDPFSGEAILLRGRGNGYVAYSVGPDLDDDRGLTLSDVGNINKDGDLTFRVIALPDR